MGAFEAQRIRSEMPHRDLEEFISMGMDLREKKDNISWDLGDLANDVTRELGPRFLSDFSKGIGIPIGSMRRYRDIARAYPKQVREEYKVLSWTHFRMLAAREDRDLWLRRAADESWSTEKLAEMIRDRQPTEQPLVDDGLPVPPKPELYFCEGCRRWYLDPEYEYCPSEGQCMDIHK